MDRAKYVAKVSGLAIAAGVGVAMAGGAGVAAADAGDSDSEGGASSSASSSDSGSVSSSGDPDANTSAGPADPKSADHSPATKRSTKLPRVSTKASGAKSAKSEEAESTAGPTRRPGSSSVTDRSDGDRSGTADETSASTDPRTSADDDAAPAASDATPASSDVADATVETVDSQLFSSQTIVPSTAIVAVPALPNKPHTPVSPAGVASVVEMLGAARRDTNAAAELLAAASSVAVSLAGSSTPVVTAAAAGAPVVVGVTAVPSSAGAPYKVGETVYIDVEFDRDVVALGTVALKLETGVTDRVAIAGTQAPGRTIRFSYVVQQGDRTFDLDYASTGALTVSGGSIRDAVTDEDADLTLAAPGTGGSLGANSNVAVDGVVPTVTANVADGALRAGETTLVTFTFSEAVTGFSNADVAVPNGVMSALSSSDGGITWTATFTPSANVTDATNVIVLDNTGVFNAMGNAGVGQTVSNNFTIDTQRPQAFVVVRDQSVRVGETTLVTFTFSEAVVGFTASDITVANGTLSGLASSDGGVTWTASFTPTTNVTDTTNVITIDNAGFIDASGNPGAGNTISNNFAIDTQRPTATISLADTVLQGGQATTVTFTFSEAVTGFNNSGITVENGTLSAVSSADGGVTWTATFTPDSNVADATNVVTVAMAAVTDVAGNAGAGTVTSDNYAVEDTQGPTATITMANTALKRGQSTTVTFMFSERVTGFDLGDVTVANGRLSALSTTDGGLTYTATFTPRSYVRDSTNVITVNGTGAGVSDAAGNALIGSAASANYSVQTVPGGFKGFVWSVFDFLVNDVVRPIGKFVHMLFFGPPPHLNHELPVTPWSVES